MPENDLKSVVVLSGGMDSGAALYWTMKVQDRDPLCLSFNYGQRHGAPELSCARRLTSRLGLEHHVISLITLTPMLRSSALVDQDQDVPEGHYAHETMKATVVPNRNMMMLSIAWAVAVAGDYDSVVAGMHAGDHDVYPDCREDFLVGFEGVARLANRGFGNEDLELTTPWVNLTKRQIAEQGEELGVPWHETWSCYKGGAIHCGRCSTCVERLEALDGFNDNTVYQDKDYWRSVVS